MGKQHYKVCESLKTVLAEVAGI